MVDADPVPYCPVEDNPVTGSVDRQLGDIAATLRSFQEDIRELKDAHRSLTEERRRDSHALQRNQQALTSRMDAFERQAATQHESNVRRFEEMAKDIAAMKDPVAQFVGIRKRAGSFLVMVVSVIGVIWTLAEPIYQFVISKILTRP